MCFRDSKESLTKSRLNRVRLFRVDINVEIKFFKMLMLFKIRLLIRLQSQA